MISRWPDGRRDRAARSSRPASGSRRRGSTVGPGGDRRYEFGSVPPGTYDVILEETFLRPNPDEGKPGMAIRQEAAEERSTVLGRIEIRAGESASFDVKLP